MSGDIGDLFDYYLDDLPDPPYADRGLFAWQKFVLDRHVDTALRPVGAKKLLEVARGHGKTELLALLCAYYIVKFPQIRIIYGSATDELAEGVVGEVHNILSDDRLVEKIGKPVIAGGKTAGGTAGSESSKKKFKRRSDQFTVFDAGGSKDPTMWSVSYHKRITGHRYDLLILDDLISLETVDSPVVQIAINKWLGEAVGARRATVDRWVVGTPKSIDDYYWRLEKSGEWDVIKIPALEFVPSFHRTTYVDPLGRVVNDYVVDGPRPRVSCPELWTVEDLLRTLHSEDLGSRLFLQEYQLEYQLGTENSVFDYTKFRTFSDETEPPYFNDNRFVCVVDPTSSRERNVDGDYFALVIACFHDGNVYVDHVEREHLSWDEQIAAIERVAREFPDVRIYIENSSHQKPLVEAAKKSLGFSKVQSIKAKGEKRKRICSAIDPLLDTGHLYVRREYFSFYLDEVTHYRGAKHDHDDLLDATAYAISILTTGGTRILPTARW